MGNGEKKGRKLVEAKGLSMESNGSRPTVGVVELLEPFIK